MNKYENPLITICMMTYNQESYVRDAVLGLLSQTYSPLEIVISDDASVDSTWEIINEEVEKYKKNGGQHQIRLNKNAANLGISKHFERITKLSHGALLVLAGGDDISLPERVSIIYTAWNKAGRMAKVIFHDGMRINPSGVIVGRVGFRCVDAPLGACMAYSAEIFNSFSSIEEEGCFEDHIYSRRGALLGDVLNLPDVLVKYRIGSGVSSVYQNRRAPELRAAIARVAAYKQSIRDLDWLKKRNKLDDDKYDVLKRQYEDRMLRDMNFIKLMNSSRLFDRCKAYYQLYLKSFDLKSAIIRFPYLLPRKAGDYIYRLYDIRKNK